MPVTRPRLAATTGRSDLFAEVRRGDLLVHLPYDSFATSVELFVRAAAKDRDVVGIKTTVYRTSDDSAMLPALIDAAEQGKQTVCLVELKARFDERRNIEWSRAMEQAGVHVVYGYANLKIHAKMTLIVRRDGERLHRYAHIGTGNYNSNTARSYEDVGLFTDDEAITADLADLFNHLTGFGRPQRFRKILAAPFNLRSGLIERIRAVARAAAVGERARIRIKVNADRGGAVQGLAGGCRDRHHRPQHLHAAARCARAVGDDPGAERGRAVSRAQPCVRVRGGRYRDLSAGQRRPDAAQPRPSHRGGGADRGRSRPRGGLDGAGLAPGRQHRLAAVG
jgi:polyphosphate kinase